MNTKTKYGGNITMLNKIILIGRLTQDPELKYTTSGHAVTRMTIAVDRNYKNKNGEKQTDFIPIITWNKLAEIVAEHMKKGKLISATGSLEIRSYEKEGSKRYIAEVIADDIKFLDKKES